MKKTIACNFQGAKCPGKENVNLCLTFELMVETPRIAILVADLANINAPIDSIDALFLLDFREDLISLST